MRKLSEKFSAAEKAVWAAAYGSAFAVEFRRSEASVGFDVAVRAASAESCCDIADLAVVRLREWRDTEESFRSLRPSENLLEVAAEPL